MDPAESYFDRGQREVEQAAALAALATSERVFGTISYCSATLCLTRALGPLFSPHELLLQTVELAVFDDLFAL